MVVYNRSTVKTCVLSIEKRNRHVCAFDELSEDKLFEILEIYKKSCDAIGDNSSVVQIDRDNRSQNDNVSHVMSKILEKE